MDLLINEITFHNTHAVVRSGGFQLNYRRYRLCMEKEILCTVERRYNECHGTEKMFVIAGSSL